MTEEKKKRGRPPGSGKKKPEIRNVDPVSPEVAAAMYNAEHPNQHTEVYELTPEQFKEKFGLDPVSLDLPKNEFTTEEGPIIKLNVQSTIGPLKERKAGKIGLYAKFIEGTQKKQDYDPYSNPRFKSKNNLK